MTNRIIITKVIDTEHKVCELRNDVMNVALYLYETGRPDWYISEFANSKLDFLNAFIELKQPFNNDISSKNLVYTGKSSLKFYIDVFDIFVTDYYKDLSTNPHKIIGHSILNPYKTLRTTICKLMLQI